MAPYWPKTADVRSCQRHPKVQKAWNVYHLVLYRNKVPIPGIHSYIPCPLLQFLLIDWLEKERWKHWLVIPLILAFELILVCVLTGVWTRNLSVSGRCFNQLSHPASPLFLLLLNLESGELLLKNGGISLAFSLESAVCSAWRSQLLPGHPRNITPFPSLRANTCSRPCPSRLSCECPSMFPGPGDCTVLWFPHTLPPLP